MKTYNTQNIADADIDQVVINRDPQTGNVWVRANIRATLMNAVDSRDVQTINLPIRALATDLGVGAAVLTIRNAILTLGKTKV